MNGYGYDVDVTLAYSNGESATYRWPRCRASFVGRREAQLEKVTFATHGHVLREFNAEEIRGLIEQEKRVKSYHVWSVSEKGAVLLTRQDQNVCR